MSTQTLPITTVAVTFGNEGKVYDFVCPVVIAETLTEGTLCIVDTYRGPAFVKVYKVHADPQLQPKINYRWLIQEGGHGVKTDKSWQAFLFSVKRTVSKYYAEENNYTLPFTLNMPEPPINPLGNPEPQD